MPQPPCSYSLSLTASAIPTSSATKFLMFLSKTEASLQGIGYYIPVVCISAALRYWMSSKGRGHRARLDREPRRVAWYPGSEKRAAAFKAAIPGVEELGAIVEDDQQAAAPSSYMPWLFKAGLSPEQVCPDCLPC